MRIQKKHLYIGLAVTTIAVGVGVYLFRRRVYEHFDYKTDMLLLTLEPSFRKKIRYFLSKAKRKGIELRVISGYRSCQEQNKLYAQGRSTPGKIVTNARCGKSAHNYKVAVDVVEFKNGKPLWNNPRWEEIGALGESCELEWGGRWRSFKDRPHFQDLKGQKLSSLYRKYKQTGRLEVS